MEKQPKTVHVFDYSTFAGFTKEQIRKFILAKKKRKRKATVRKKAK